MDLDVSDAENVRFDRAFVARFGLRGFVRLAWPIVEPAVDFVPNWHLDELAAHAQAVTEGRLRRLVINIPPGTGKSVTISQAWNPWAWIERPGLKFIFASYSDGLATRDAQRAKRIVSSAWYRARWPDVELVGGARAPDGMFENSRGGFRFSTSVRGEVTGRHADIQVVDDPHKPIDLAGVDPANLRLVAQWWGGTMSTRLADPKTARRVVVMQRLHEDDLAGICQRDGYESLILPMKFEPERASRTSVGGDRRTEEGELLFPARYPAEEVERIAKDLGDEARAQLQQDPHHKGGGVLRADLFRFWPVLPPRFDRLIWSWDCSFKGAEGSDNVCGQLWGRSGPDCFLIHRHLAKMAFSETVQAIEDLVAWSRVQFGLAGEILIEDKANGTAALDVLRKRIPGLVAVNPLGGKVARANAVGYLFRGGNVFFPDPSVGRYAWVREHVDECRRFPRVRHDDSVDAMTQALLFLEQSTGGMRDALANRRSNK